MPSGVSMFWRCPERTWAVRIRTWAVRIGIRRWAKPTRTDVCSQESKSVV
jgi:hypothetical protein